MRLRVDVERHVAHAACRPCRGRPRVRRPGARALHGHDDSVSGTTVSSAMTDAARLREREAHRAGDVRRILQLLPDRGRGSGRAGTACACPPVTIAVTRTPSGRQLGVQRVREAEQAPLARVVRRGVRPRPLRGRRGDVDDVAALPAQRRQRVLREQERPAQVGADHPVPFLDRQRIDVLGDVGAGVVHDRVQPAERAAARRRRSERRRPRRRRRPATPTARAPSRRVLRAPVPSTDAGPVGDDQRRARARPARGRSLRRAPARRR